LIIGKYYGIIYCATNLLNNKKYIGQTQRKLERRISEHISAASRNSEFAIHQAINKYGKENFEWVILGEANSQDELDEKECYWIKYFDSYNHGGYNCAIGGQYSKTEYNNSEDLSKTFGGKEFCVFDLDGNFIKSMYSQTAFADEIGVCVQTVNNVLRGIKQSTSNYILIFKDGITEEKITNQTKKIKDRHKPFAVFNKKHEFVGIWNNKNHCASEINCSHRTMERQLLECKGVDTFRKYQFFYIENIPENLKDKIKEVI